MNFASSFDHVVGNGNAHQRNVEAWLSPYRLCNQFDPAVSELVDTANDLEFLLRYRRGKDRGRSFQVRDGVNYVLAACPLMRTHAR